MGEKTNPKKWKDFLLSSGLPLEQSVTQILRNMGIEWIREYKYERFNENGIPTIFSVDIHAQVIESNWLNIFIKCKYRYAETTQWVFIPEEYEIDDDSSHSFVTLKELADEELNFTFPFEYDLCGKGVEILEKSQDLSSIKHGVYQLRFAVVEEIVEALLHQAGHLLGSKNPNFIFLPIIVTTAQLWRIRPSITVEQIKIASEISEIADKKGALLVKMLPDEQLIRHTRARMKERLSSLDRKNIDQILGKKKIQQKSPFSNYHHYLDVLSSYNPSYFLVVNYANINDELTKLITAFGFTLKNG